MKPSTLVRKFKDCSALVVGDICLDRWCHYDPRESDPSRETKIPRLGIVRTEVTPGAGGTVANNLASLGTGRVAVLGAIGQDGFGFELERALGANNIDYRLLVASPELQTFTYSKLINARNDKEDKPRVDFINNRPLPGDVEDQLIANFHAAYKKFDVIIVSDQAETKQGGVVSDAFREVIADVAERNPHKIVLVDSRTRIDRFRNTIAKANRQEADEACRKLFGKVDYARLRDAIGTEPLIITRGKRGALLIDDSGRTTIPAVKPERTVDSCGAGDSFSAGMALALQVTGDFQEAAGFGNLVSSITVTKPGTGFATPAEVIAKARSMRNGDLRTGSPG
jgi:rfaE bifunctional protein kinase chain/domain